MHVGELGVALGQHYRVRIIVPSIPSNREC